MKIVDDHFELDIHGHHEHECPGCREIWECDDTKRCRLLAVKLCQDCWDLSTGKRTQEKNKQV